MGICSVREINGEGPVQPVHRSHFTSLTRRSGSVWFGLVDNVAELKVETNGAGAYVRYKTVHMSGVENDIHVLRRLHLHPSRSSKEKLLICTLVTIKT